MVCAPSKDSDQPGHPPSLIRVFTVHLKIDRILSYSLSVQWRLWSDWASAHCRLIWVFAGLACQFVGFVTTRLKLWQSYFWKWRSGKILCLRFMSASAWVQVLDFTKSLVYSNCRNDSKCCCFFVYVPRMRFITYMFVYHFGRIWCFASIICKKGSLGNTASKAWKQQMRSIHAR